MWEGRDSYPVSEGWLTCRAGNIFLLKLSYLVCVYRDFFLLSRPYSLLLCYFLLCHDSILQSLGRGEKN